MRLKMSKKKELTNYIFIIYNVIGKKNNQTSFSDADREIPTRWSTHKAGNEVNLFSALSVSPRFGISLSESETDDRFYFSCIYEYSKHVL